MADGMWHLIHRIKGCKQRKIRSLHRAPGQGFAWGMAAKKLTQVEYGEPRHVPQVDEVQENERGRLGVEKEEGDESIHRTTLAVLLY